ncbi:hypothetical protein SprV_0802556000 [Sparganum proliferum]
MGLNDCQLSRDAAVSAAAKAKREARKSQVPRLFSANHPPLPTSSLCQRAFRARVGLVKHLRTQCAINPAASTSSPTLTSVERPAQTATLVTVNHIVATPPRHPPCPNSCRVQHHHHHVFTHSPHRLDEVGRPINFKHPHLQRRGLGLWRPHCGRTSTSHIGLVGHLRIHRTKTGEPVPGAPTYTRRIRLNCPHCTRIFAHRAGLFGHESGIDRISDTLSTSSAPTMPRPAYTSPPRATTTTSSITLSTSCTTTMLSPSDTPSPCALTTNSTITVTEADTDTTDFSCPHCPRTFTLRIDLVSHSRIHHTETGEPVSGAQHTPTASASTAITAPAHSLTAWVYLDTGAFTRTCGRQPPATSHHHTFPHQHSHLLTPSAITST